MTCKELTTFFVSREWEERLQKLYGRAAISGQKKRYEHLADSFFSFFGSENNDVQIFRSPGRTEIGGNHTDHNYGKVLTASIDLDSISVASPSCDGLVSIHDLTYREDFSVSVSDMDKRPGERGAISLVRGILKGFSDRGYQIGGFRACISSNVISAAGVSSSASFEMLICAMIDDFYNAASVPKTVYAQIGQYAENTYWDKQSGLLDQTACAVGGLLAVDFADPKNPVIRKPDVNFSDYGYSLVIVNTGSDHADLSRDYSAIPMEMKNVANFFGKSVCREITMDRLLEEIEAVGTEVGDRAVLRALHFMEENDRVDREVSALEDGDFAAFLYEVTSSGDSSWKWLQNCYRPCDDRDQAIPLTLALTDLFIRKNGLGAAHRVHGGGFAGVILVILPDSSTEDYMSYIRKAGKEPYKMSIRDYGAVNVLKI